MDINTDYVGKTLFLQNDINISESAGGSDNGCFYLTEDIPNATITIDCNGHTIYKYDEIVSSGVFSTMSSGSGYSIDTFTLQNCNIDLQNDSFAGVIDISGSGHLGSAQDVNNINILNSTVYMNNDNGNLVYIDTRYHENSELGNLDTITLDFTGSEVTLDDTTFMFLSYSYIDNITISNLNLDANASGMEYMIKFHNNPPFLNTPIDAINIIDSDLNFIYNYGFMSNNMGDYVISDMDINFTNTPVSFDKGFVYFWDTYIGNLSFYNLNATKTELNGSTFFFARDNGGDDNVEIGQLDFIDCDVNLTAGDFLWLGIDQDHNLDVNFSGSNIRFENSEYLDAPSRLIYFADDTGIPVNVDYINVYDLRIPSDFNLHSIVYVKDQNPSSTFDINGIVFDNYYNGFGFGGNNVYLDYTDPNDFIQIIVQNSASTSSFMVHTEDEMTFDAVGKSFITFDHTTQSTGITFDVNNFNVENGSFFSFLDTNIDVSEFKFLFPGATLQYSHFSSPNSTVDVAGEIIYIDDSNILHFEIAGYIGESNTFINIGDFSGESNISDLNMHNNSLTYSDYIIYSYEGEDVQGTIYDNAFIDNGADYNFYEVMPSTNGFDNIDFNIPKTEATNVMGGLNIAGNYWGTTEEDGFSDICEDLDLDGICDDSYTFTDNQGSNITDYLPLATAPMEISVSSCSEIGTSGTITEDHLGKTYIFDSDFNMPESSACVTFDVVGGEDSNVTIDCDGHTFNVDMENRFINFTENDTELTRLIIKNCNINLNNNNNSKLLYVDGTTRLEHVDIIDSNITVSSNDIEEFVRIGTGFSGGSIDFNFSGSFFDLTPKTHFNFGCSAEVTIRDLNLLKSSSSDSGRIVSIGSRTDKLNIFDSDIIQHCLMGFIYVATDSNYVNTVDINFNGSYIESRCEGVSYFSPFLSFGNDQESPLNEINVYDINADLNNSIFFTSMNMSGSVDNIDLNKLSVSGRINMYGNSPAYETELEMGFGEPRSALSGFYYPIFANDSQITFDLNGLDLTLSDKVSFFKTIDYFGPGMAGDINVGNLTIRNANITYNSEWPFVFLNDLYPAENFYEVGTITFEDSNVLFTSDANVFELKNLSDDSVTFAFDNSEFTNAEKLFYLTDSDVNNLTITGFDGNVDTLLYLDSDSNAYDFNIHNNDVEYTYLFNTWTTSHYVNDYSGVFYNNRFVDKRSDLPDLQIRGASTPNFDFNIVLNEDDPENRNLWLDDGSNATGGNLWLNSEGNNLCETDVEEPYGICDNDYEVYIEFIMMVGDYNRYDYLPLTVYEEAPEEFNLRMDSIDANSYELEFGESADINCAYTNLGDDNASSYDLNLYLQALIGEELMEGSIQHYSGANLNAGESTYYEFTISNSDSEETPAGDYNFYCVLSSDDDTNSEDNNSEIITVTFLEEEVGEADLTVTDVLLTDLYETDVNIYCDITNSGNADTNEDLNVILYIDSSIEDYIESSDIIGSENMVRFTLGPWTASVGDYNIGCVVDYSGEESNESNNSRFEDFTIYDSASITDCLGAISDANLDKMYFLQNDIDVNHENCFDINSVVDGLEKGFAIDCNGHKIIGIDYPSILVSITNPISEIVLNNCEFEDIYGIVELNDFVPDDNFDEVNIYVTNSFINNSTNVVQVKMDSDLNWSGGILNLDFDGSDFNYVYELFDYYSSSSASFELEELNLYNIDTNDSEYDVNLYNVLDFVNIRTSNSDGLIDIGSINVYNSNIHSRGYDLINFEIDDSENFDLESIRIEDSNIHGEIDAIDLRIETEEDNVDFSKLNIDLINSDFNVDDAISSFDLYMYASSLDLNIDVNYAGSTFGSGVTVLNEMYGGFYRLPPVSDTLNFTISNLELDRNAGSYDEPIMLFATMGGGLYFDIDQDINKIISLPTGILNVDFDDSYVNGSGIFLYYGIITGYEEVNFNFEGLDLDINNASLDILEDFSDINIDDINADFWPIYQNMPMIVLLDPMSTVININDLDMGTAEKTTLIGLIDFGYLNSMEQYYEEHGYTLESSNVDEINIDLAEDYLDLDGIIFAVYGMSDLNLFGFGDENNLFLDSYLEVNFDPNDVYNIHSPAIIVGNADLNNFSINGLQVSSDTFLTIVGDSNLYNFSIEDCVIDSNILLGIDENVTLISALLQDNNIDANQMIYNLGHVQDLEVKDNNLNVNYFVYTEAPMTATFYNNVIYEDTNGVYIDGVDDEDVEVEFNLAPTLGTNLRGGHYLGGNYWINEDGNGHSQDLVQCDPGTNGFCEEELDISSNEGIYADNYPLYDPYVDLGITSVELDSTNVGLINVTCNYESFGHFTATEDYNIALYVDEELIDSEVENENLEPEDFDSKEFSWTADAGDHNVECRITYDGEDGNSLNDSMISEETIGGVDLSVTDISVNSLNVGPIAVRCRVDNVGIATARRDLNVILTADGNYIDHELVSADIPEEEGINVTLDWDANAGFYDLECMVDYQGSDENSDNNSRTEEFIIGEADLTVTDISLNTTIAGAIAVRCSLENLNLANATDDFNVMLFVDENIEDFENITSGLDGEETMNVTLNWTATTGDHNLECIVNYEGIDANADNNSRTETFTITSGGGDGDGDGDGGGSGGNGGGGGASEVKVIVDINIIDSTFGSYNDSIFDAKLGKTGNASIGNMNLILRIKVGETFLDLKSISFSDSDFVNGTFTHRFDFDLQDVANYQRLIDDIKKTNSNKVTIRFDVASGTSIANSVTKEVYLDYLDVDFNVVGLQTEEDIYLLKPEDIVTLNGNEVVMFLFDLGILNIGSDRNFKIELVNVTENKAVFSKGFQLMGANGLFATNEVVIQEGTEISLQDEYTFEDLDVDTNSLFEMRIVGDDYTGNNTFRFYIMKSVKGGETIYEEVKTPAERIVETVLSPWMIIVIIILALIIIGMIAYHYFFERNKKREGLDGWKYHQSFGESYKPEKPRNTRTKHKGLEDWHKQIEKKHKMPDHSIKASGLEDMKTKI